MRPLSALFSLLLASAAVPTCAQEQPAGQYDPVARPGAVVAAGHARFTMLTDRMIRIEWAEDGTFEDHASLAFLQRNLPVPRFTVTRQGQTVRIRTAALALEYRRDGKPDASNLSIAYRLNGRPNSWHPGDKDQANLGGTARTLDQARGATLKYPIEPGLISRDGWVLIDDSKRPLFTSADFRFAAGLESDWPWYKLRPAGARSDWYFLGYGHDYKAALADFRTVSGPVPLPPRWSLGSWWTRYWPYSDRDLLKLVEEFRDEGVPLDGLTIDMDWHLSHFQLAERGLKDPSGYQLGWTGYSWNKVLFPDPDAFLNTLHSDGLHVTLNLHPASGVQPFEQAYPAMARAMGQDPAKGEYVPFDILNQDFARNYMNILHHPLEKAGVDFWWLDWQQADRYKSPGIDSTFWINYVHFTDQQREGKRPLLFGRWGGLGNHRYPMGFSGDVYTSWESLAFQPYFTATAANVGFAYWNHDIGGHIPGPIDAELYTRWVQWGAFSPTLRTHTAPGAYAERRIWAYPEPYAAAMRAAFRARYALLPYIYTEARRTYDQGIALVHPLYYEWPEAADAYAFRDEYLFGSEMIIAPVVAPADPRTKLVTQKLWIPPGEWIEQTSGKHFTGPAVMERRYGIDDVPALVRAGAILPMAPPMLRSDERPLDPLLIQVQPMRDGSQSHYTLYEDSSDGESYTRGEAAWTDLSAERRGDDMIVRIAAARGNYPGMPKSRAYQVSLPGGWPPDAVTVNGQPLNVAAKDAAGWRYSGDRLQTIITTSRFEVGQPVEVRIRRNASLAAQEWKLDGAAGAIENLDRARLVVTDEFPIGHPPDVLGNAAETGMRIGWKPDNAAQEIDALLVAAHQVRPAVTAMQADAPGKIEAAVARTIADRNAPAFRQRADEYAARLDQSLALVDAALADLPSAPKR